MKKSLWPVLAVTANLKSPEIDVVKCPKAAGIFVKTGID